MTSVSLSSVVTCLAVQSLEHYLWIQRGQTYPLVETYSVWMVEVTLPPFSPNSFAVFCFPVFFQYPLSFKITCYKFYRQNNNKMITLLAVTIKFFKKLLVNKNLGKLNTAHLQNCIPSFSHPYIFEYNLNSCITSYLFLQIKVTGYYSSRFFKKSAKLT